MHIVTNGRRRGGLVFGLVALLAALVLTLPLGAQEPERFDEKVRELFFAGFAGNQDALQRGMAICEEALAAEPDHPGALAWQASGWFFQSGAAFTQGDWEAGMALFNKSLAQFDRAVALAPDSFQTLIPRAATLLGAAPYVTHAPTRDEFLEKVVGDYTKVLELQEPYFDSLAVHSRGELLGALAEALWLQEKGDEAQVYLSRIIAELPDSQYALMAQRQLDNPETRTQLTCLGCHKY